MDYLQAHDEIFKLSNVTNVHYNDYEECEITLDGIKIWRDEQGNIHNDNDQPSIIFPNGKMVWMNHGYIHRGNNLPAIIYEDSKREWYEHGVCYKVNYYLLIPPCDAQNVYEKLK